MRFYLAIILSVLISTSAFAGSGTAVLTCKSASGRTTFSARLQDIIGLLENAKFTIDKESIEFNDQEEIFTIFEPENSVFTFYIQGKTDKKFTNHKYVKFWAVPSTFKIVKNESGHQIYEFKAKVFGTEPRPNKYLLTPYIELDCRLEYQI